MPPTRRLSWQRIAMILVGVLLLGACTPESHGPPPDQLQTARIPWPTEQPRPVETLLEPGEWIETPIPERMIPIGFVEIAGTLHLALRGDSHHAAEAHLLSWDGGGWSAPTAPIVHPDAQGFAQEWSKALPFGESGMVLIGSQSEGQGPISALTTDLEHFAFSAVDEPTSQPILAAASDGSTVIALGRATQGQREGAAWRSVDGITWTEVALPSVSPTTELLDIAVADGTWVIATLTERRAGVLVSATTAAWSYFELPRPNLKGRGTYEIGAIGHDGTEFVVIGSGTYPGNRLRQDVTWRSATGRSWSEPEGPNPAVFGDGNLLISTGVSTGAGFFVSAHTIHKTDAPHCYDDSTTCRHRVRTAWVRSDGTWRRLGSPTGSAPRQLAVFEDTLFAARSSDGPAVAYWAPGRTDALPLARPFDLTPAAHSLPMASGRDVLVSGEVYAYPLDRHLTPCSAGRFHGQHWFVAEIVPGAGRIIAESGAAVEGTLYGTVEQIAGDRIEYAIPGHGPVAYLEPGIPKDCEPSNTL